MSDESRMPFDLESYVERVRTGPCFVCGIVDGRSLPQLLPGGPLSQLAATDQSTQTAVMAAHLVRATTFC